MAERTAADAALAHEPLVKQEPSHAALGEPCTNVYDALFDVVKHEVSDAACGEVKPTAAEVRLPADTWNTDNSLPAPDPTAGRTALATEDDIPSRTHSLTGHHTKSFSDNICNYKNENKITLNRHLKTQTGDKAFVANDLHFHDGSSTADIIAGDVFFEIIDPPELGYSYRIRPAKDFGAPFNGSIYFEEARLVPTIPFHSCSDIKNQEEIFGNIALSERGECSFVHKTMKAQLAGARAVIITETQDTWDDHLIEMVDDKMDLDVNIPAAFLLGRSGETILRTLKRLRKKYAIINLPINMTHVPMGKMNQPPWIPW